ncbi:Os07g0147150 [Oryza sativa Japonica Group]|uniref:Os07g0147150 protein n=1 Tax=Oryza sativa subsp. japonica TaxID=39947 RepID=A0A0P0X2M4_ORYSJ|nr:Os07g0147150 [Oryza sativa Japonica Group]
MTKVKLAELRKTSSKIIQTAVKNAIDRGLRQCRDDHVHEPLLKTRTPLDRPVTPSAASTETALFEEFSIESEEHRLQSYRQEPTRRFILNPNGVLNLNTTARRFEESLHTPTCLEHARIRITATEPLSCNDLAERASISNQQACHQELQQKHVEIQPTNKLEQLIQPTNEQEQQQQLLQPTPSVLVREPETAGPETPHPPPSLWPSNEPRPAAPDPPPQALVAMERTPNAPDPSIFSDAAGIASDTAQTLDVESKPAAVQIKSDTGTATATNTTATIVFSDRHEATPAKLQKGQTRATGRPDYGRTPT